MISVPGAAPAEMSAMPAEIAAAPPKILALSAMILLAVSAGVSSAAEPATGMPRNETCAVASLLMVMLCSSCAGATAAVASLVALMQATTPIGLVKPVGISIACAAPPFTLSDRLKAAPPLSCAVEFAKPALRLRCAVAIWVTSTVWLPAAAVALALTEKAFGWLLLVWMMLKSLWSLSAENAVFSPSST